MDWFALLLTAIAFAIVPACILVLVADLALDAITDWLFVAIERKARRHGRER